MLLTISWHGRSLWSSHLLEMRFFSTRASGDTFFENCQKILVHHDEKHKELASIYHLCLTAGFRGKYFNSEYDEDINRIKTDLYNFFTGEKKDIKELSEIALLPSGYVENNSKNILMKSYSVFNKLLFANLIIIITFIIIAYFVWFHNKNLIFKNL